MAMDELSRGKHRRLKVRQEDGAKDESYEGNSGGASSMVIKSRRLEDGYSPNHLRGTILIVSALIAVLFIAFGSLQYYLPLASKCGSYRPYNFTQLGRPRVLDDGRISYDFVVVTDLDHHSKREDLKWQSFLKKGNLVVDANMNSVDVIWDNEDGHTILLSHFAAGGRSMELSDLAIFDGHLLTVDDRTGVLYRIEDFKNVIPWVFLNDGPGNTVKGFKGEWMTIKNQHLYVGGLGKEWTTEKGVFVNFHPMYVKRISSTGEVEHLDWIDNYKKLRRAVGIEYPGYMIHEAAQWSDFHNRWFFLPRRVSSQAYSEIEDEYKGSNLLLIADASFSNIEVKQIGDKGDGSRGFSAFQFLPGTDDDIIVALKSQEKDGVAVASYLVVFSVSSGRILLEEKALTGQFKFEGIAFV